MPDNEYVASLQILIAKIDGLATAGCAREELLLKINGHVRDHGEQLAAQKQWIWGHKKTHEDLEEEMHCLSNRLWTLSGGTGALAIVANVLQFMRL